MSNSSEEDACAGATPITRTSSLTVLGRWPEPTDGNFLHDQKRHTVVMKFFQSSMFPRDSNDGLTANDFALNEVHAFLAMTAIQGKVVPLSHGFFSVCIDAQEVVIVHVMEFINATTLAQVDKSQYLSSLHMVANPLDFVSALEQIHNCGVCHQDMNASTILIQPSCTNPRPVFIDFGLARVYKETDDDATMNAFIKAKLADQKCLIRILIVVGYQVPQLRRLLPEELFANVRERPPPVCDVDVAELWKSTPPPAKWSCKV
ncbi:hypothetical protein DL96DRAFT_1576789 [Flagelloscypha sp. PMI_526]|nr:hypothetical protein DL96DRAFT_1576789 [Flagelloscypha sp. PMI_526]